MERSDPQRRLEPAGLAGNQTASLTTEITETTEKTKTNFFSYLWSLWPLWFKVGA